MEDFIVNSTFEGDGRHIDQEDSETAVQDGRPGSGM